MTARGGTRSKIRSVSKKRPLRERVPHPRRVNRDPWWELERFQRFVRSFDRIGPLGTSILLVGPVVVAALFFVWTHVTTVRLGYELSSAGENHRLLVEENRTLRVEVAALKAPERLKLLARRNYGLLAPTPAQIIRLSEGPIR